VKIDRQIVFPAAEPANKSQEGDESLVGRNDQDLVQVRVSLDQPAKRLLDHIGERRPGQGPLQSSDRRRRHDDVAAAAETNEENLVR
jgi:hypothetical protein